MPNKKCLILKKNSYQSKDNRTVHRLHLWIDDGLVEYSQCSTDESTYSKVVPNSYYDLNYDYSVFNSKIYGVKNVTLK